MVAGGGWKSWCVSNNDTLNNFSQENEIKILYTNQTTHTHTYRNFVPKWAKISEQKKKKEKKKQFQVGCFAGSLTGYYSSLNKGKGFSFSFHFVLSRFFSFFCCQQWRTSSDNIFYYFFAFVSNMYTKLKNILFCLVWFAIENQYVFGCVCVWVRNLCNKQYNNTTIMYICMHV